MSTRTNTPRSRSKLYKARYPLEGAPPQLRLHVAVIVQEASDREVEGDKENGHAGESLVLFDFLPEVIQFGYRRVKWLYFARLYYTGTKNRCGPECHPPTLVWAIMRQEETYEMVTKAYIP